MQNQYTSYKLSKKLAEVGFDNEAKYCWWQVDDDYSKYDDFVLLDEYKSDDIYFIDRENYPAYDLIWDLCIRYKDEVWFDGYANCEICGARNINDCCNEPNTDIISSEYYHPQQVLLLLQQGDKQAAEDYILKHSILFNK